MIASELRIGNWINAYHNDVQVTSINSEPDHLSLQISTTPTLVGSTHGGMYFPIPLTEGWLIKFGFGKPINSSFYEIAIGGSTLQINPDNGVTWISRNGMSLNITQLIESVHKLQNLFHSWTGKELTIKQIE